MKRMRPHAPKVSLRSASSASNGRLPTKTRHEPDAWVSVGVAWALDCTGKGCGQLSDSGSVCT